MVSVTQMVKVNPKSAINVTLLDEMRPSSIKVKFGHLSCARLLALHIFVVSIIVVTTTTIIIFVAVVLVAVM